MSAAGLAAAPRRPAGEGGAEGGGGGELGWKSPAKAWSEALPVRQASWHIICFKEMGGVGGKD